MFCYCVLVLEYWRRGDAGPLQHFAGDRALFISLNYAEAEAFFRNVDYRDFNWRAWKPSRKLLVKIPFGEIQEGLCNQECMLEEEIVDAPEFLHMSQ
jgi:hypothetical protein